MGIITCSPSLDDGEIVHVDYRGSLVRASVEPVCIEHVDGIDEPARHAIGSTDAILELILPIPHASTSIGSRVHAIRITCDIVEDRRAIPPASAAGHGVPGAAIVAREGSLGADEQAAVIVHLQGMDIVVRQRVGILIPVLGDISSHPVDDEDAEVEETYVDDVIIDGNWGRVEVVGAERLP